MTDPIRPQAGGALRSQRESEMDEWTSSDGQVDVAKVMAGIREKIRGRRDLGLYSEDEVEELTALKLQAFADDAGIDPELLARLMADNHNWNIATDYRIETHRRGWSARLLVLLKKAVHPWVRLYTDGPLGHQAQINLYLHYLCHNLVREVVRLQVETAALRNRLQAQAGGSAGHPPADGPQRSGNPGAGEPAGSGTGNGRRA